MIWTISTLLKGPFYIINSLDYIYNLSIKIFKIGIIILIFLLIIPNLNNTPIIQIWNNQSKNISDLESLDFIKEPLKPFRRGYRKYKDDNLPFDVYLKTLEKPKIKLPGWFSIILSNKYFLTNLLTLKKWIFNRETVEDDIDKKLIKSILEDIANVKKGKK